MKVIIFQPHNDDAMISIGGIVQKMLAAGWELIYVYMTDSRHGSNLMTPEKTMSIRANEAEKERRNLGIKKFYELGVEDGTLSRIIESDLTAIEERIIRVLEKESPGIIFVPTKADMHTDHRATHEIALEAAKRCGLKTLIIKYPVWLLPDFYAKNNDIADSVLLVNVDREFEKKIDTLRMHESQIREGGYDDLVEHLNRYLALIYKAYREKDAEHAEIIGLFDTNNNKDMMEEFVKMLGKFDDVTKMFHGRSEESISF